jgi:glycerol kinase
VLIGLLADLTGREVWRVAETETTALGAAFLAGLATGVWSTPAEACGRAQPPARVAPQLADGERAARREGWRALLLRVAERG